MTGHKMRPTVIANEFYVGAHIMRPYTIRFRRGKQLFHPQKSAISSGPGIRPYQI